MAEASAAAAAGDEAAPPAKHPIIFQQDAQPVRVYVPHNIDAQLRAQVCRQVKLHGGKVETAKLDNSNIVIFDLDAPVASRNSYRTAKARDPPLPVVPASWILDSVQAGQMCDPKQPKYDPIACLERYQKQKQDAQAAARSGAAQLQAQAHAAALTAQAEAEETKRRTSMNGRAPYDHIDRRQIVELLATSAEPYSVLAIAKELHERYGRHSVMSYQTRLRDHLDKSDNYAARARALRAEQQQQQQQQQRNQASSSSAAVAVKAPQLEFLTSSTDEAEQYEQEPSPGAQGNGDKPDDDEAQLSDDASREAPAPAATISPAATVPAALNAKQNVRAVPPPPPLPRPMAAGKAKFMPLEREALGRKLASLFEAARVKGKVSDANLADRDARAAGAQHNPLLNPPEPLWQELADEFPSHSAADWQLHYDKNIHAYLEMARLTLRLEATQRQAAHVAEPDLENDNLMNLAHDDADVDMHDSPSNESALPASPEPSTSSRRLSRESEALSLDQRTLDTTVHEPDHTSPFLDAASEPGSDEEEHNARTKRRRVKSEQDENMVRQGDLACTTYVDDNRRSKEPHLPVEQAEIRAEQPRTPPKRFSEQRSHRSSSGQHDDHRGYGSIASTSRREVSPSPRLTPGAARLAAQEKRAKKQYLREVVALRDDFGFVAVSQMLPFLQQDGDLSAGRQRLQALVDNYTHEYSLSHEKVLEAIRRGSGRLDQAEKIMKAMQDGRM